MLVEVEEGLVARIDQIIAATRDKAPLSVETVVNLAIEAFVEGMEEVEA